MIRLVCRTCRLVWDEDRRKGDSPVSHWVFICPRCGELGERK